MPLCYQQNLTKYIKYILLTFLMLSMTGCVNRYNQPEPSNNNALLVIHQGVPFQFNSPFGMIINAELDGHLIDAYKYPQMSVKVRPGIHILTIDVNAYYYNRAKYNTTKEYKINFKPNQKYIISAMPSTKVLHDNKANVNSNYSIISDNFKIEDTILLKDSALRSMACQGEGCKIMITEAVVEGLIPTIIQWRFRKS